MKRINPDRPQTASENTIRYRQRNLEAVRAYQNERMSQRQAALNILKSGPCHDCGNSFPAYVMDFDHRPGVDKVGNVSALLGHRWDTVLAEIAKCDLVCSNCHRVRTFTARGH